MKKLSNVKSKKKAYAWCPTCRTTYEDDVPMDGSIRCPKCKDVCVVRGLSEIRGKK